MGTPLPLYNTKMESQPILNVAVAITRLLDDKALYHALLRKFCEMHAQELDKVDADLRRGAETEVSKRLHALRGASAIVGAERLGAAAAAFWRAFPGTGASPLLNLRTIFDATLVAIKQELGDCE